MRTISVNNKQLGLKWPPFPTRVLLCFFYFFGIGQFFDVLEASQENLFEMVKKTFESRWSLGKESLNDPSRIPQGSLKNPMEPSTLAFGGGEEKEVKTLFLFHLKEKKRRRRRRRRRGRTWWMLPIPPCGWVCRRRKSTAISVDPNVFV